VVEDEAVGAVEVAEDVEVVEHLVVAEA